MVTIFGIVFLVCCTLSLTQGQVPKNEEYKRNVLLPHAYVILAEKRENDMPHSVMMTKEMLDSAEGKIPYEVLASLVG
ncbi:unnamed protein product, partial [Brenthis ino]